MNLSAIAMKLPPPSALAITALIISLCLTGCATSKFPFSNLAVATVTASPTAGVLPNATVLPIENELPFSSTIQFFPGNPDADSTRLPGPVQPASDESTPIVAAQAIFFPDEERSKPTKNSPQDRPDDVEPKQPSFKNASESSNAAVEDSKLTTATLDVAAQAEAERLARQLKLSGNYQIETGDSLDIKFRVAKELNDLVTVRPDGMISLQIIGDQLAAGLTPEQLRAQLEAAYSNDVSTPDLAVIVRSFSGNSIYVGGEVVSPVRVPLTGRVTTLKAVILAGGFKDTADRKRVVVRHEDGTCCQYNLKSVIECKSRGQDVQLRPYDIVYVPKSKIAKVNLFVEQYIDKVIPFSRSFGVFVSHNTGLNGGMTGP